MCARPFAADMTLHRELPWLVIELFTHVFTNTLEFTTTYATFALRFMVPLYARQIGRQRRTLWSGLLVRCICWHISRLELVELCLNRRQISVHRLVE